MRRAHIIIGLIAVFFAALYWRRKDVIHMVGVVDDLPAVIAERDGVTVDVESLARIGMSEESSTIGRTAVMWAAKNMAAKRGVSITFLATSAKHIVDGEHIVEEYDGHYTRDLAGKFCSTYQEPDGDTLNLAQSVLDGSIPDPTSGATHWLSFPAWGSRTQEAFEAEGLTEISIPGITRTRFWG